jgi:hypothetical protein
MYWYWGFCRPIRLADFPLAARVSRRPPQQWHCFFVEERERGEVAAVKIFRGCPTHSSTLLVTLSEHEIFLLFLWSTVPQMIYIHIYILYTSGRAATVPTPNLFWASLRHSLCHMLYLSTVLHILSPLYSAAYITPTLPYIFCLLCTTSYAYPLRNLRCLCAIQILSGLRRILRLFCTSHFPPILHYILHLHCAILCTTFYTYSAPYIFHLLCTTFYIYSAL